VTSVGCASHEKGFGCMGDELTPPFRHICPPNPSNTIVARSEDYTYAAKVWMRSRTFSLSPLLVRGRRLP
jgi:hypothetical protein